jgi:FkbM family methyltransferase
MIAYQGVESKDGMLRQIRLHLKRYPSLVAFYRRLIKPSAVLSDWWNTHFPKRKNTVLTPMGFKLVSSNYAANRAMQAGAFEVEETEIIRHHLSSAEVFVDVGANIGLYTCVARSEGKYAIAVEPQPRNLECLYAGLSLNGWTDTEVYPVGLGDRHGVVTLYGASGTSASLLSGWGRYSPRFQQTIPLTTLDALLSDRFDGKKLLIKIDVEGAEYGVLKGAERILSMLPHPTWMVEIFLDEHHPGGQNLDYSAIFDVFWSHGYEARTADHEDRLITPRDIQNWIAAKRSTTGENFIFVPKVK